MDSDSDDLNLEEDGSEAQSPSNNSIHSDPPNPSSKHSDLSIESTASFSEETYTEQVLANTRQLKSELQAQFQQDWLNRLQSREQNPKIELNLLLHGTVRKEILTKDIPSGNDSKTNTEIFQNDLCRLQRIFEELVNDQRNQRIIYTEVVLRPDLFNFPTEIPSIKLKNMIAMIIECIRSESYSTGPTPMHLKILLSCNWNSAKSMPTFIRLALDYSEEIVGINLYGQEDDCRKYWQDFRKYTQMLHQYHIGCQASMPDYQDLQLMTDVIKELGIERLSEAYRLVLSSEHLEEILVKHGLHLLLCPVSDAYQTANDILSETKRKRQYQSTGSSDSTTDAEHPDRTTSYHLINYLQSELISYSITSLSPIEYKENLSSIYQNLLEKNKNSFTCEHMQWLNENAIKSSFASQKLKTELITFIRESYEDCSKQNILFEQFQAAQQKWQKEMNEIVDRNTQTALEFARKMREEKLLKRVQNHKERQSQSHVEEEEEEENESDHKE